MRAPELPKLPATASAGMAERVLETLAASGYNEKDVLERLGVVSLPPFRHRSDLVREHGSSDPLDILIGLFILRQPEPHDLFSRLFLNSFVEDIQSLGLAARDAEGALVANFELAPSGDRLVASDWPFGHRNEVMGIQASTRALMLMTIRRGSGRTLDLGSGGGIQSIAAASHSGFVVGCDVNPRAVRLARFNASLNRCDNVQFREGDLFEPVQGESFDLIVCNPPFVIGPGLGAVHSSAGKVSDSFTERVVRKAPAFLNEGGYAQVVCNWAQIGDETARSHVHQWFDDAGCDAWVLHDHTESAEVYAERRAAENSRTTSETASLREEWLRYFERYKIAAVNFGVITMRRRSTGKCWVRYDELPGVNGPCGRSIELAFKLQDFLETHNDERLLRARFRRSPDLEIEAADVAGNVYLRHNEGLTFAARVDREISDFVTAYQSEKTLGEHVRRIAAARHVPVSLLLPGFLFVVRQLVKVGFLIPNDVISLLDK